MVRRCLQSADDIDLNKYQHQIIVQGESDGHQIVHTFDTPLDNRDGIWSLAVKAQSLPNDFARYVFDDDVTLSIEYIESKGSDLVTTASGEFTVQDVAYASDEEDLVNLLQRTLTQNHLFIPDNSLSQHAGNDVTLDKLLNVSVSTTISGQKRLFFRCLDYMELTNDPLTPGSGSGGEDSSSHSDEEFEDAPGRPPEVPSLQIRVQCSALSFRWTTMEPGRSATALEALPKPTYPSDMFIYTMLNEADNAYMKVPYQENRPIVFTQFVPTGHKKRNTLSKEETNLCYIPLQKGQIYQLTFTLLSKKREDSGLTPMDFTTALQDRTLRQKVCINALLATKVFLGTNNNN